LFAIFINFNNDNGTQIAQNLNDIIPQNAELTKVSLVSCNSATCAGNNTSLVQDVEKNTDTHCKELNKLITTNYHLVRNKFSRNDFDELVN
jgi:hypothetical protein